MKRTAILLLALLATGCGSLYAVRTDADASQSETQSDGRLPAGTTLTLFGSSFPMTVTGPDGQPVNIMPPCGQTAVVVNPDGSHSVAIINGQTATIVN